MEKTAAIARARRAAPADSAVTDALNGYSPPTPTPSKQRESAI